MNIIIVGCGKVGYTLAETLSEENHNVSVVDVNEEPLSRLSALDVSVIKGNGSSYRALQEAGVRDCDILIAVTNRDEVNMLCCLIAKKTGNCRTIARVRDPEYYEEIDFIKDELGLSLAINPELSAANYIYHLIRCPSAMELNIFAKGRVHMPSLVIPEKSPWDGKNLIQISGDTPYPLLIAMVESNQQLFIPDGKTVLHAGDRISLIMASETMTDTFHRIGIFPKPIKNVMIMGGGTVAYYLARRLIQSHIHVTIIEAKRDRCKELSDLLPKANIIFGNASNEQLLLEEGLEDADAVVSLTNFDEENIMLALYANRMSHAKLITKVNKTNFNCVINEIPVGSVVSPKHLTAETILHYARAMRNSPDSDVEAVHMLADNRVEAMAFRIKDQSSVTNQTLAKLRIKKGVLIGAIIRDKAVIVPTGQDQLLPGDFVIVVTTLRGIDSIKGILE
jgi:trk system potassium uptake protein TrkA